MSAVKLDDARHVISAAEVNYSRNPRRKEHVMEHLTYYRTVEIDGLSICYREAGPKDTPTIVLLHGVTSSRQFEPLFAQWQKDGYKS